MKVFVFDIARCNGCHNCQIACKDEHCGNDWAPIAAPQPDTGHFWLKVESIEHGQAPKVKMEYRPLMCNHCASAACMFDAEDCVYRRDDGLVVIDPQKARGRKDLVDACPYGRIYWNEELQIPQKCTGCAHLVDEGGVPHCVDLCATGALRFGEESDFTEELQNAEVLASPGAGARVYYLNLPKLFIGGEVWDPEEDEIIEGARVTLSSSGGEVLAVASDGFGDFWFKRLEPGDYELRIEAEGYEPVERSIQLTKSLNVGDFPLKRLGA